MKIPHLPQPQDYIGLYIYYWRDLARVGYTAEEIALLLSSPQVSGGQAFEIHHATAAGEFALRGVTHIDVQQREGLRFWQTSMAAAQIEYRHLVELALKVAPPTVVWWQRWQVSGEDFPVANILLYTAVHSAVISRWLDAIAFRGGVQVEGGQRVVEWVTRQTEPPAEQIAIAPHARYHSRPLSKLLETLPQPLQR
ncbi:MAG: hypothetical protein HJJLKODD_02074 [Phycisphaerae bacterium]|nr:hypothetical protein [Phycisphaerae bacterium]